MTVAVGNRSAKGKFGHVRIFPIEEVYPSPENDRLYRPVNADDPDILTLADSIRAHGVQEPLILTSDNYIISGHRRYAAAELAELKEIPCRIRKDVSRLGNPDEFMRLLRECNRQRIKSLDEQLREEVVSASPEEAYESLIEHRRKKSGMADFSAAMDLGEVKSRKQISAAKTPLLNAVLRVLRDYREFLPISDRKIHYALLDDPPLTHASKPDSIYKMDDPSYDKLTDILTRGRVAGLIPWDAICDETRPVTVWTVHQNSQSFIREELDDLLKGYWRDLLQSQPNHIEMLIEKNTLLGQLKPVAGQYCIPITSGRGFSSIQPRHDIDVRYRRSGKEKLILLIVSDHDPAGMTIAESFARSMRDDFGIDKIEAIKVALRPEHVLLFKLKPSGTAKECSTKKKFVELYGDNVFEVEALRPDQLQELTRKAIDAVIDTDAFNHELDREKEEAALLDTSRRRMLRAMEGVAGNTKS